MPQYLSPGVYVEEVPSAVQPIAGVGTSTAGFIGIIPATVQVPRPNPHYDPSKDKGEKIEIEVEPEVDNLLGLTLAGGAAEGGDSPATGNLIKDEKDAKPVIAGMKKAKSNKIEIANLPYLLLGFAPSTEIKLCTNFSEFKKFFGDFSLDPAHRNLAHAVYGFFNNGGTLCYVGCVSNTGGIGGILEKFEAIDEVAIVVAPGLNDPVVRSAITTHCQQNTQDRFAIFDSPEIVETKNDLDLTLLSPSNDKNLLPDNSNYAAFYFPWIQVFDPATKIQDLDGDGLQFVPPGGHVAGIYARVDTNRGVHKAPANEPVLGALDLKYNLSKSQQDTLNPQGVNCIRDLNGNIRVWGARTIGGDANGEWKYINVRRLFLYLRESIDEGTQWVVFEPNDMALWAKITRNVVAFLTNVWRSGALFGSTPQEAFYVKCDAETNPPEVRDLGQVVTEIGVAVVKPAEFVIFRISQWAGSGQ